jgi:hypothetical protein
VIGRVVHSRYSLLSPFLDVWLLLLLLLLAAIAYITQHSLFVHFSLIERNVVWLVCLTALTKLHCCHHCSFLPSSCSVYIIRYPTVVATRTPTYHSTPITTHLDFEHLQKCRVVRYVPNESIFHLSSRRSALSSPLFSRLDYPFAFVCLFVFCRKELCQQQQGHELASSWIVKKVHGNLLLRCRLYTQGLHLSSRHDTSSRTSDRQTRDRDDNNFERAMHGLFGRIVLLYEWQLSQTTS